LLLNGNISANAADILAMNGIIHAILDQVLVSPDMAQLQAEPAFAASLLFVSGLLFDD